MLRFFIASLLLTSAFAVAQAVNESSKPAPAASPSNATPDALSEATKLYREGHFDAAIQKYQQIIDEKPNFSEAYAGLARVDRKSVV